MEVQFVFLWTICVRSFWHLAEALSLASEKVRRITPPVAIKAFSFLVALGWFSSLSGNPDFLHNSNYMRPVERYISIEAVIIGFLVLALLEIASIYATRQDWTRDMSDIGLASPLRVANTWPVFGLMVASYACAAGIWLYWAIITNAALLTTGAGSLSPYTGFHLGLSAVSFIYAITNGVHFTAAQEVLRREQEAEREAAELRLVAA
jgi:hypothetical protein